GGRRHAVACEAQDAAQEGNRQRGTTSAEALRVREVVGMARGLCFEFDLVFLEPTPAQAKAVFGKIPPTASKEQVARAISALVSGCPATMTEHVSDAIGNALAGARIAHGASVLKRGRK